MNVAIKELSNDSRQIRDVQEFLFKMIKKEFGYGYVPEWHQDIVKLDLISLTPQLMSNPTPPGDTIPFLILNAATPPIGNPYPK